MIKNIRSPREVKFQNALALLHALEEFGPQTRAKLALRMRLSIPTVMGLVQTLAEAGFVEEGARIKGKGRAVPAIVIPPDAWWAMAVDVGGTFVRAALVNSQRMTVRSLTAPTPRSVPGMLGWLRQLADEWSAVAGGRPFGISLGFPGVVSDGGVLSSAPNIAEHELQITDRLAGLWRWPTWVDNDVNLGALGEYQALRRHDPALHSLVYCAAGTGIGAGLVLDGELWRGAHGAAGEIGYLLPSMEAALADPPAGGHMEHLAATSSLSRTWVPNQPPEATAAAARAGDRGALAAIRQWALALATALVNTVVVINPQVVVLGGSAAHLWDLAGPLLGEVFERQVPFPIQLRPTALGDYATVQGASHVALRNTMTKAVGDSILTA